MKRTINTRLDKLEAAIARHQPRSKSERDAAVAAAVTQLHRAYLAGEDMETVIRSLVPDEDVSPGTIGERRLAAVRAMAKTVMELEEKI